MNNTLVMYPNKQYNPILVPDYTLVEFYREKIHVDTDLGYCIIPLKGKGRVEIDEIIKAKANTIKPDDLSNLAILTNSKGELNHNIIYAVWYNAEEPVYPPEPSVEELIPASPHNVWETREVVNEGAPAFCEVSLTLSSFGFIEFYINDDYFSFVADDPQGTAVVSNKGVFYNGKMISNFKMTAAPKLKAGVNYFKVKCIDINKMSVKYKKKF